MRLIHKKKKKNHHIDKKVHIYNWFIPHLMIFSESKIKFSCLIPFFYIYIRKLYRYIIGKNKFEKCLGAVIISESDQGVNKNVYDVIKITASYYFRR